MFFFAPRTIQLGQGKPTLRISIDVGRDRFAAPTTELQLAVYDLDAYFAAQADAADTADATDPDSDEEFETGPGFFTGNERGGTSQPSRALILPSSFRAPTPEPFNGIIAVATLILKRVETDDEIATAIQFGEGPWYVSQIVESDFVTHRDTPFTIDINMFAQRDDQGNFARGSLRRQKIGSIGFAKDFLKTSLETKRGLAFRLVSTKDQGPLRTGSIALSSVNPRENVANRGNIASRLVNVNIADAVAKLTKPGAATPTDPGAPSIPSRRKDPDLTGWYELVATEPGIDPKAKEYVAPAALWINQAGEALVGWYYRMEAVGMSRALMGAAANAGPAFERACFVSARSKDFPEGARIYWFSASVGDDPNELITGVQFPDAVSDIRIRTGRYDIFKNEDDTTEVEILFSRQWVMFPDEAVDDDARGVVARFRRIHLRARLPWISVEQMRGSSGASPKAIDEVVRVRVEPLSVGFWGSIGRFLTDRFTTIIKDFARTPDLAPVVEAVFNRSSATINEVVASFPNEQYRLQALSWVASFSNSTIFTDDVGASGRPLASWLKQICSQHIQIKIQKKEAETGRAIRESERKEIVDELRSSGGGVLEGVGAFVGTEFEYDIEFKNQGVSGQVVVGIVGGGTVCTVKKFRLVDGVRDGLPEYNLGLAGVYAGIGAGFSYSILAGKTSTGASGSPPSCTIRSFHDISASDWKSFQTWFKVAAVAGPGLGGSVPFVSISVINSSSVQLTLTLLTKDITLSAILNNVGTWSFSTKDVKGVLDDLKGGDVAKANATLFSISETIGFMNPIGTTGRPPPESGLPLIPEQNNPLDAETNSSLISFAKGSSVILTEQLLDFDRRLAMYRSLFEIVGWYMCVGFTSPEWNSPGQDPDTANLNLSKNRATATDAALTASLGSPGAGVIRTEKQRIAPIGNGRKPSLMPVSEGGGGLSDPFDRSISRETLAAEEGEYSAWRRVDVLVNATLIARIKSQ